MKIRIYTDGACSGNPGPGGWGAIILLPNSREELAGNEDCTTNNRMELKAVLESVKRMHELEYIKVDIYSDSAYVVNAVKNKWLKKWYHNGWKTVRGENVKNTDLWEELYDLLDSDLGIEFAFIKVKGHSGDKNNELVDKLAKTEVDRVKTSIGK